jgi:Bacterial transcriptional activator domain/Bacterial extracellular solute-binding proteins, family 5 Middle
MEFRVLGSLEVVDHDGPVALGAPQQRALLAVLLLHRGEPVSTDRLIDEIWGEQPPASANKIVQGYVSNLRKLLGDGQLVTQGRSYVLRIGRGQADVDRFEALAAEGRGALENGDALTAAAVLREALGVWRGPPLADFAYEPFAQPEIARLEEACLAALEDRIDADLVSGEDPRLVGEPEALVRERRWTPPDGGPLLYATCAKLLNYPDRAGAAGAQLVPEVAQGLPTRSADGRTYTFTIRPGFRFSPPSDQPVTAETFKYTIERTLNPKTESPFAQYLGDVVGADAHMAGKAGGISGVSAIGNKLIIRLLAPEPDFVPGSR